jgi:hypothetical protein
MSGYLESSFTFTMILSLLCCFSVEPEPLCAQENQKIVELILDSSGSMKGRLPDGELKIAAAKKSVEHLINDLPDGMSLAFRAYGHQSPRQEHDCNDTQLLVDFDAVANIKDQVMASLNSLTAQGYTPITLVLQQASEDFPDDSRAEKVIILVSDGKETCEGDPCALAAALQSSGASIVIHTIGLGVDSATKGQLECIAGNTGGRYFPASGAIDLVDVLATAIETSAENPSHDQGKGWLRVEGADLSGHDIFDAVTGEELDQSISHVQASVELPAGIYNVSVGKALWKSIQVKAGETTTLEPGWIEVNNAWYRSHKIVDAETGTRHASVSNTNSSAAVMPGEYIVTFNKAEWPVTVKAGETVILNPGSVAVKSAYIGGHPIFNDQGEKIGNVSATGNWMPLPPGDYTIEIDDQVFPFTIEEGETVNFERK